MTTYFNLCNFFLTVLWPIYLYIFSSALAIIFILVLIEFSLKILSVHYYYNLIFAKLSGLLWYVKQALIYRLESTYVLETSYLYYSTYYIILQLWLMTSLDFLNIRKVDLIMLWTAVLFVSTEINRILQIQEKYIQTNSTLPVFREYSTMHERNLWVIGFSKVPEKFL